MPVTINGTTGIAGVDGSASTPAVQGTDTNTGIFFPAADTIAFGEGGAEAMRIDSSGNVGIGTTTPNNRLTVAAGSTWYSGTFAGSGGTDRVVIGNLSGLTTVGGHSSALDAWKDFAISGTTLRFQTDGSEKARITNGGDFLVAKTSDTDAVGFTASASGYIRVVRNGDTVAVFNRATSDGTIVSLQQDAVQEGSISVSGTTVSYNGGNLARYAQLTVPKDETNLLKGTVMSNLDEMNVYVAPTTYWTEEDELPEGVSVGDVKVETHTVANEQLNKVKVSDVEGDVNVAGVFVNWSYDEQHQVDEINMAMTGDMIIRIAQGVVVQKGDLLMSAGDGTAKPQGDDIVRSKTVAKVTSNHVTCTYEDGSYCVPCVLMAC